MKKKSTVVEVNNVSKVYKLYNQPFDRVKEALSFSKKNYHKRFHALNSVSLSIKRGEALGVIGKNGNGKSTLLKIIANVLSPNSGQVKTKGKISAILELTSNLKPEMTGRENIIYNLKLQNFSSKKDIILKTQEIEKFADIGDFIDQPIKTYSSGMKSRLGFGIATSVEPDILILDEVLAVGDFNFQQKCLAKINAMRENISMIFVSHSMNSVKLFCDRVVVLEKGNLTFNGKPDDAISYYLEEEDKAQIQITHKSIKPFYGDIFHNNQKIIDIKHQWQDQNSIRIEKSHTGDKIFLDISFKLLYKPRKLVIGIPIWNEKGDYISGISSEDDTINLQPQNHQNYKIRLELTNILNPAQYISILSIYDGAEALYRGRNNDLIVINTQKRYFGHVSLEHKWNTKHNITQTFTFNSILLTIDKTDKGGLMYNGKSSFEELNNKFYLDIKKQYNPDSVIDIGANYGFTSIIYHKFFDYKSLIAIEASKDLCKYIAMNFKQNNVQNFKIINAICAETDDEARYFSLNPNASQDNRVIGENKNWEKISTETISLNKLLYESNATFHFIKIDTQGYERHVFAGAYRYLDSHTNWIIKTEFAPYWLKSQGANPETLLLTLLNKYDVYELALRTNFKNSLPNMNRGDKLQKHEVTPFIQYIVQHNKHERGWCDLLITPKEGTK